MTKPIKIYLADNCQYRTTQQLIKYWESQPDIDLDCDPYWNPLKAEWADVIWVEWAETAAQLASKRGGKGGEAEFKDIRIDHILQPDKEKYDWSGKLLIVRAIDLDVYCGHFRGIKWENVDVLAYSTKHIFEYMDREMHFAERFPKLKIVHMPFSINLEEWTFKKRSAGKNIAWINHNWSGKGFPLMLQALKKLEDETAKKYNYSYVSWKLHVVCDWSSEHWFKPYIEHIIKELGLTNNVIFYPKQKSIDEFLEGMDYLVSSSYKETFSLITAEGLAKGIKTLTHNWQGAKNVWPEEMVWSSIDEFVEKMLKDDYDSEKYRKWVEKYDKKFEIEQANKLINYESTLQ
jgi:glycosyltransferase involved in cell wall biosynthesis